MPRVQEPQAPVATPTESNVMRELLSALTALKRGKSGVRLPLEWTGVAGKVADAFNEVVELNERMAGELARLEPGRRQRRQALRADARWAMSAASGKSRSTRSTS